MLNFTLKQASSGPLALRGCARPGSMDHRTWAHESQWTPLSGLGDFWTSRARTFGLYSSHSWSMRRLLYFLIVLLGREPSSSMNTPEAVLSPTPPPPTVTSTQHHPFCLLCPRLTSMDSCNRVISLVLFLNS